MASMAEFVVATGLPPSAYWESTRDETNAVIRAFNRRQEQRRKKRG